MNIHWHRMYIITSTQTEVSHQFQITITQAAVEFPNWWNVSQQFRCHYDNGIFQCHASRILATATQTLPQSISDLLVTFGDILTDWLIGILSLTISSGYSLLHAARFPTSHSAAFFTSQGFSSKESKYFQVAKSRLSTALKNNINFSSKTFQKAWSFLCLCRNTVPSCDLLLLGRFAVLRT